MPEVIYETEVEGHLVSLSAVRQSVEYWAFTVATDPPAEGWVILRIGSCPYRARLMAGSASIEAVPSAALDADEGPDLVGQLVFDPSPA